MTDADTADFSPEQRRYLEGLVAGMNAARSVVAAGPAAGVPTGPDAPHLLAMARTEAEGKKLVDQEKWKSDEHPHDAYQRLKSEAVTGAYPKPPDNFRWRFHGLFYVAPNQNSFMCRLRIPNGILNHWQMAGLALLAESHGGGYSHVTTRANLQIREIAAERAPALLEAIQDLGLTAKGSGADNIRNVTGTPTAGIDPQELIDTRPFARAWHFHVLNARTLHGLPRKFNVAFDGGGQIAALEETNDIGFSAVEVVDGGGVEAGVWFRLMLGGITGHKDFARPTGIYVKPKETTEVADAIVRIFIEHGDRTNRDKARLKYLLDAWGFEKFVAEIETRLDRPLVRISEDAIKPRPQPDRLAHVGVHPQKQPNENWIGVVLPSGRMQAPQMAQLARIAREFGDGDIRLTVWQNLILSGVPDERVADSVAAIEASGLAIAATPLRAGLISCTGNKGCKFAASDTKGTAEAIAAHVEARLTLDSPINIHLTGCHHSCAQHYVGDIGMIACKVPRGEDEDPVEGFHIFVGGGTGDDARLARELWTSVEAERCPSAVERLLAGYLAHRTSPDETFLAFSARHDIAALKSIVGESRTMSINFAPQIIAPDAPFSDAQRAWLNRFFADVLLRDLAVSAAPPAAPQEDESTPWKDPAMAIEERMELAAQRPVRWKLMAAMAQQDCGQCGYNCTDYSKAIFEQAEPRLNLCQPGGKATARMLKTLVEEMGGGVIDPEEVAARAAAAPKTPSDGRLGYSREHPVAARFVGRSRLNGDGSEKVTNHIEIDLSESGLQYEVGDSLGVFPANDPGLADAVIAAIDVPPDFPIAGEPFRQVLIERTSLGAAPDALFQFISYLTGGERRLKAKGLARGEDPDGDAAQLDVLAALQKFAGIRPDPEALIEVLEPLQPRLYSISSSPKTNPGRVSLTVDAVRYEALGRQRLGVASTWFDERLDQSGQVLVYVQKAHNFALPADGATPIVMVGPGTGIAPFRAFLHERMATDAAGPAWLFFGHQREATDFFYRDEWDMLRHKGVLTNLSLAWSRDGAQKIYVQQRIREAGAELWSWFERGAHFYVCGDAKRMAKDVEAAVRDVAAAHGGMSEEEAAAYLAKLKADGRYQADVY